MQCATTPSDIFIHPHLTQQPLYKTNPWPQGNVFTSETEMIMNMISGQKICWIKPIYTFMQYLLFQSLVFCGFRPTCSSGLLSFQNKSYYLRGEGRSSFRWHLFVICSLDYSIPLDLLDRSKGMLCVRETSLTVDQVLHDYPIYCCCSSCTWEVPK